MPYQNEWKENGLHRQFTGSITGKEVLESNLYIHGDERFDNIRYVFNDFTRIDGFDVTELNIAEISTMDNVAAMYSKKLKIIIVANNEDFLHWARLYLTHMENSPFDVDIYEDIDCALNAIS